MRLSFHFMAVLLLSCSGLAASQTLTKEKPVALPDPVAVPGDGCPDISGTYRACPENGKSQCYAEDSLALRMFTYTDGRLNVPQWMWRETSVVKVDYAKPTGLTITAFDADDKNNERRNVLPAAIECREGMIVLKWNTRNSTEGTTHDSRSYLTLYNAPSGDLIVSQNVIDHSSALLFLSQTIESHNWFNYPAADKK